jgi:hypothetical protein
MDKPKTKEIAPRNQYFAAFLAVSDGEQKEKMFSFFKNTQSHIYGESKPFFGTSLGAKVPFFAVFVQTLLLLNTSFRNAQLAINI